MTNEALEYMRKTLRQIEERDSKGDKWDMAHYLGVARICRCQNCYCCAVLQWHKKQGGKA